ncbi:hypothetical protein CASFOL_005765 [Castilleja foliolosa]|uniref:Uncharacterized protein n=1 Tax=Castilleja foliolosa TaxID=1961234 RepID=A0ABD3E4Y1_9LAMI
MKIGDDGVSDLDDDRTGWLRTIAADLVSGERFPACALVDVCYARRVESGSPIYVTTFLDYFAVELFCVVSTINEVFHGYMRMFRAVAMLSGSVDGESNWIFDELPKASIVHVSRPDAGDISPVRLT